MKNHNQFVRCVENIQDLSLQEKYNYALVLGGGFAFSKKKIKYDQKTKMYSIDGYKVSGKQFMKELEGKVMAKRSLIAVID